MTGVYNLSLAKLHHRRARLPIYLFVQSPTVSLDIARYSIDAFKDTHTFRFVGQTYKLVFVDFFVSSTAMTSPAVTSHPPRAPRPAGDSFIRWLTHTYTEIPYTPKHTHLDAPPDTRKDTPAAHNYSLYIYIYVQSEF